MAWPTTSNPRRNFVTLRITDDEANDLDWLMAEMKARSRSEALRTALHRVVRAQRRKAARATSPVSPASGGDSDG